MTNGFEAQNECLGRTERQRNTSRHQAPVHDVSKALLTGYYTPDDSSHTVVLGGSIAKACAHDDIIDVFICSYTHVTPYNYYSSDASIMLYSTYLFCHDTQTTTSSNMLLCIGSYCKVSSFIGIGITNSTYRIVLGHERASANPYAPS